MSFFFTDRVEMERDAIKKNNEESKKRQEMLDRNIARLREEENNKIDKILKDFDKFENDKINKILKNMDFYNKLHEQRHGEEGLFIGFVDIQKLNYNDFVSYELFIKLTTCYSDDGQERVCGKRTMFDNIRTLSNPPLNIRLLVSGNKSYYDDSYVDDCYLSKLKILNPEIFLSNVNIKWKMLQLAKKDTSIQIQTTKPSPKTSPKPSPKNSPTKPKSQSPTKPKYQSPPKQKTYNWDNTDNPTRPPPEYKPSKSWF